MSSIICPLTEILKRRKKAWARPIGRNALPTPTSSFTTSNAILKVEVVEESVEEPVAKPKAKRAPRKKVENLEESTPLELPVVAPRKSRAAAKLELYEQLALNALP